MLFQTQSLKIHDLNHRFTVHTINSINPLGLLIFRQKSFQFCIPCLKTRQPVLPQCIDFCQYSSTKVQLIRTFKRWNIQQPPISIKILKVAVCSIFWIFLLCPTKVLQLATGRKAKCFQDATKNLCKSLFASNSDC